MQFKKKFVYIVLSRVLLLSGVVLLINVWAQVPKQAQIVFSSNRDSRYWDIYIMDADGKNPRRLTNNPADDWGPNWFDPAFAYPISPAGRLRATWGWLKQACP